MRPPQSVVHAGLAAIPKGPLADLLTTYPAETVEVFADMIGAAVAAYPRAQCDQQGHDFTVYCTPESIDPNLVVCGRCKTSWLMHPVVPLAPAPEPVVAEASAKTPSKAKGKARAREAPPASGPASAPELAPPSPAPPPGESKAVEEPTGPLDVDELDEGAEDEETMPGHCSSCGGEVESETFVAEVAKNFHGAQLCRDCLLSCESCGNAIESIDQARISMVRWKSRLCLNCHKEAAVPAGS